jgi:hypothetical protein
MPSYAKNIVCCFGRMNGQTVGVRHLLFSCLLRNDVLIYEDCSK